MLNGKGIDYEVALEVLGQSRQPWMSELAQEQTRPNPSKSFIAYCNARLSAIDELQDELRLDDVDTVARILDKNSKLFRT